MCLSDKHGIISENFSPIFDLRGLESSKFGFNSPPSGLDMNRPVGVKLTPPKEITFWIAVALGLLGLFSFLGVFTLLPIEAFWLLYSSALLY